MRSYQFVTLDVFTERRFGGNPLGVFPDAHGLAESEMQSLASELNLSETTFVLPPRASCGCVWPEPCRQPTRRKRIVA